MSSSTAKSMHFPWHQNTEYWLTIYPKTDSFAAPVRFCLESAGFQLSVDDAMSLRTGKDWKTAWEKVYTGLKQLGALGAVEVIFSPDINAPAKRSDGDCKTPADIQHLAESMWLGDALIDNRLICYLQPVMSSSDKVFGYESFARVKAVDGTIIGGDKIIEACKALGIEHMVDRMLHIEAIKTFVGSDFNGFLFVNFFPGFIHRPAVYLEGLAETAQSFGVVPKHIVLDFTNSEIQRDIHHLNSVCDYARSRGYSIALDDVSSLSNAKKLLSEIRPDFIKIDRSLVYKVTEPGQREIIRSLVEVAHKSGSTVIAEGVETQNDFLELKLLGVDLFQGYLFSAPVPVETAMAKAKGATSAP